jgi:hypothetical protein
VLCPPTLIKTWEKALAKFGQGFLTPGDVKTLSSKGSSKSKKAQKALSTQAPKVFLVPYTMLSKFSADHVISPHQFGIVIADESHNLKERESQRTSHALPYLKQARITVALTGTPEVNRPVELYTQIHGIRPDIFNDYQGFVKRYCDAKEGRHGEQDVKGSSNEAELKNVLHHTVMIRRLKSDVLNDLASKCREIRKVPADPAHLDEYRELDRKYQLVLDKISRRGGGGEGFQRDLEGEKAGLQTMQYQLTGLCKVKAVVSELEELVRAARVHSEVKASIEENSRAEIEDLAKETSEGGGEGGGGGVVEIDLRGGDVGDDRAGGECPHAAVISALESDDFIQSPVPLPLPSSHSPHHSVAKEEIRPDPPVLVISDSDDEALTNSSDSEDDRDEGAQTGRGGKVVAGKKRRLLRKGGKRGEGIRHLPKRRLSNGRACMAEDIDSDSHIDLVSDDDDDDIGDGDYCPTEEDEDEKETFFCDQPLTTAKKKRTKQEKKKSNGSGSAASAVGDASTKRRPRSSTRRSSSLSSSLSLSSDDEDVKKTWQTIFSGGGGKSAGGSAQKRSNKSGKAKGTSGVGVRSSAKKRKKKSKDAGLFLEDLDNEGEVLESNFESKRSPNTGLRHKIVVFAHHKKVMDALEVGKDVIKYLFIECGKVVKKCG